MFENLIPGLILSIQLEALSLTLAGTLLGIIIGAIPGIGPVFGIAIAIPFTYGLEGWKAINLFISIYCGCMFGGSISAILINAPGTGSAVATTLDGYPLAKQGKAITALTIAAVASFVGGTIGPLVLIFALPYLILLLYYFGSPELALLGFLGITLIASLSEKSMTKGLIMGGLGLMLSTIGLAPVAFEIRYTLGFLALYDGIDFVPVIIGLFAIAEMLRLIGEERTAISMDVELKGSRIEGIKATLKHYKTLLKSSIIGIIIGIIPGVGGSTANFMAWANARGYSKDPDSFGKGNPEGVVATESSNNAVVSGAMIPTLMFGIPGSGATAVLLGGLLLHGMRPGRNMFVGEGLVITYSLFITMIIAAIIIFFIGVIFAPSIGKFSIIPKYILIPIIFILSVLGVYIIKFSYFDILVVLIFGILGYILVENDYPIVPLLLGVIFGPIIEENLNRTYSLGHKSFLIFFHRPISLILLFLIIFILMQPLIKIWFKKIKTKI